MQNLLHDVLYKNAYTLQRGLTINLYLFDSTKQIKTNIYFISMI